MAKEEEREKLSGGVSIGNVEGGIHGIIAGRDVKDVTFTVGGQAASADETPTVDSLSQLLAEIQQELAEITTQQDALQEISPAAPLTAQGAEASIKAAADKVQPEMQQEDAKSVEQNLKEATSLLGTVLDGAKMVIEKGGEVSRAAKPLVEKLAPLVEKVAVAAFWADKLGMLG